jgi:DNA polymerase
MARSRAGRPPGDASSAERFLPRERSLSALRAAAESCRGCHLWERATQTVFGEGDGHGKAMLVGEQPGNDEDRQGRPFVGPAGVLLDRALEEAGIARDRVYVTNVVKHFKWEPRGPRRIHAKPNAMEIAACLPWLQAELDVIEPRALVCLGATAAQALLGKGFRVTQQRGQRVASTLAPFVMATVHPSSILRAPDDDARREQYEAFVEDLKKLAQPLR